MATITLTFTDKQKEALDLIYQEMGYKDAVDYFQKEGVSHFNSKFKELEVKPETDTNIDSMIDKLKAKKQTEEELPDEPIELEK